MTSQTKRPRAESFVCDSEASSASNANPSQCEGYHSLLQHANPGHSHQLDALLQFPLSSLGETRFCETAEMNGAKLFRGETLLLQELAYENRTALHPYCPVSVQQFVTANEYWAVQTTEIIGFTSSSSG